MKIEQALEFVNDEWAVLPLRIDKTPYLPAGEHKAFLYRAATEEEVRDFWKRFPDANVGLACGKVSGRTVIDIDDGEDVFPDTKTVKTPSGGFHKIYQYSAIVANAVGSYYKGIDIRNDGGYIVAAGAHCEYIKKGKKVVGDYAVIDDIPSRPFPDLLFSQKEWGGRKFDLTILNGVGEGKRNESAARYFGRMLRNAKQEDFSEIWGNGLLWNNACKPPQDERELRTTFESIAGRELSRQKSRREEVIEEDTGDLQIRSLAGVKALPVRWLWPARVAKGKLTIFGGEGGKGKSQVTIYIASVLSNGGTFIDGCGCEKGQTLFITAEDDAADTLVPRLMAQGANMENIFELQWVILPNGKPKLFSFDTGMEKLKSYLSKLPDLKLIVIDPITAFLGKTDANSSGEVRGLMHELKTAAEGRGCAIIFIAHNNKTSGQRALSRVAGSGAFGQAARMGATFGNKPLLDDEEDKDEFVMAPIKSNLTKDPPSLLYTIKTEIIPDPVEYIETSRIEWQGQSDVTAQEVSDYTPGKKKVGRPSAIADECQAKIESLTGKKTKLQGNEVKSLMDNLLIDYSKQTIKKARERLGWLAESDGFVTTWERNELLIDF